MMLREWVPRKLTEGMKWLYVRPRVLVVSLVVGMLLLLASCFLTGCATQPSMKEIQTVSATAASLKAVVPDEAAKPCTGAALPQAGTGEAGYAAFGILQTGQLDICEGRRGLAVEAINLHNLYVDKLTNDLRPLTFWEKIFGRRKVKH